MDGKEINLNAMIFYHAATKIFLCLKQLFRVVRASVDVRNMQFLEVVNFRNIHGNFY